MKTLLAILTLLCCLGCGVPMGKLDGVCNLDGSCDSAALQCVSTMSGHYCRLKPESTPKRYYESGCWCATPAGIKDCK
jgi:hypothetical protein